MSETQAAPGPPHGAGEYEIRLQGHLAGRWAGWFDGLILSCQDDGTTLIEGPVVDQAALHGLLQKVRDTGLALVSVACISAVADPTTDPTIDPNKNPTREGSSS